MWRFVRFLVVKEVNEVGYGDGIFQVVRLGFDQGLPGL